LFVEKVRTKVIRRIVVVVVNMRGKLLFSLIGYLARSMSMVIHRDRVIRGVFIVSSVVASERDRGVKIRGV
jgi:hypothetical protein